jgi:type II secretory pathway pseudopilin PulG
MATDIRMFCKSQFSREARLNRQSQGGYILLTLMLFIMLLVIFATSAVETITQQVKRDREEELVHRGVEYSRAVRHYYKKFGRYPTRIEDLESTNSVRFLRKRYKDPITGKDFKLLHQGEVQMSFGAGLGGAAALSALAANAGGAQSPQAMAAGIAAAQAAAQPATPVNTTSGDADSSDAPSGAAPGAPAGPGSSSGTSPVGSGQVFGGGPIVGVASTSKEQSIRSFNKKDHYNQWQFIYDPSSDRGGLLMTPNQPPLNINGQNPNGQPVNGQPVNGQPGSGMSGSSGGFGSQPSSPVTPPAQPAQPPETQQ